MPEHYNARVLALAFDNVSAGFGTCVVDHDDTRHFGPDTRNYGERLPSHPIAGDNHGDAADTVGTVQRGRPGYQWRAHRYTHCRATTKLMAANASSINGLDRYTHFDGSNWSAKAINPVLANVIRAQSTT